MLNKKMLKFCFMIVVLLLLNESCKSDASSDEKTTDEPIEGASLEVYRYSIEETKEEPTNESSGETKKPVKREVESTSTTTSSSSSTSSSPTETPSSKKPMVSLNDLIGKFEGSIFHSALSVVSYVSKNSSSQTQPIGHNDNLPTVKRSSNDPNEPELSSDAIFKYVTSRSVPAQGNRPARYVVDKVAVVDAKDNLTPLISSLDFVITKGHEDKSVTTQENPNDGSSASVTATERTAGKITTDHIRVSTISPPTHVQKVPVKTTPSGPVVEITPKSRIGGQKTESAQSTTGSSTVSESASSLSTVAEASSTTPSTTAAVSSSSSSSTTTTKNPIEKLKDAEDDVKEKVAEIEAEPVILSARV